MGTIASKMTTEQLGSDATDTDLAEFRGFVFRLMERDGIDEQTATDMVWGSGNYFRNARRLRLLPDYDDGQKGA